MTQSTLLQRIEGLAALLVALIGYATLEANWWIFALLLFVPDVSMLGYWVSNRAGQTIYNVVHTYALPLTVIVLSYWSHQAGWLASGLIWLAHIGLDRTLGYGLKEARGFKFTHLGELGAKSIA